MSYKQNQGDNDTISCVRTFFQRTNLTYFHLGYCNESLKSAITFPGEWNVQLNQSWWPTCLIILRKALNYISLLIKIYVLFGHVTHLAHFWPRYHVWCCPKISHFTFETKLSIQTTRINIWKQHSKNKFRSKVNSEYVFDLNWN